MKSAMINGKNNGFERIAKSNIKGVFDWEVGGWYNCLQDGDTSMIPETMEDAKEIVYEEALNDAAGNGWFQTGKAPREMRFAGSEFIMKTIDDLFDNDPDVYEIAVEMNWLGRRHGKYEESFERACAEIQAENEARAKKYCEADA